MPSIGAAEAGADLGQDLRVVVVRRGLDDRLGVALGVLALEDARADEDRFRAELAHEGRVGRGGDAAGAEVRHGQRTELGGLLHHVVAAHAAPWPRRTARPRASHCSWRMPFCDGAHVPHRLDDVAGAGLALGADHGRALADASQRLAQVAAAAHERHLEAVLVDVVLLVGRGEHLGLVDEVDLERLEDLRLGEVTDAALGHDRDGDRRLDLLDQLRVAHARHAAELADVGRDTLQRHDRHGAGLLGDLRLVGGDDVHDHAAREHAGEADLGSPGCIVRWWSFGALSCMPMSALRAVLPRHRNSTRERVECPTAPTVAPFARRRAERPMRPRPNSASLEPCHPARIDENPMRALAPDR